MPYNQSVVKSPLASYLSRGQSELCLGLAMSTGLFLVPHCCCAFATLSNPLTDPLTYTAYGLWFSDLFLSASEAPCLARREPLDWMSLIP